MTLNILYFVAILIAILVGTLSFVLVCLKLAEHHKQKKEQPKEPKKLKIKQSLNDRIYDLENVVQDIYTNLKDIEKKL